MTNTTAERKRLPQIIQGGMGVGVSNWKLARAVSTRGQLGVVSGTALASVLVRRLQDGDAGGDVRRALAHCPWREAARVIETRYFQPAGRAAGQPYRATRLYSVSSPGDLVALTVLANFVEVWLAKEAHDGVVGLNLLEKIQLPTLASLYGAMLAQVDYVLMGAGIPRAIPAALDRLAAGLGAELRVTVEGGTPERERHVDFDPESHTGEPAPLLPRPAFLAIVSSSALAMTMARKASGRVDGFVVEGASAGGHNAPPRGGLQLDARGEPVYGPRDAPDLDVIRSLGLPFWLAGSCADPGRLQAAVAAGAAGVQIGTAFAFCAESGLRSDLKQSVLQRSRAGGLDLRTDPRASPTGMPFKVVDLPGTVADPAVYERRTRNCDLGYLRQPYQKADGSIGYRCPAEPVEDFVRKGGDAADAVGRKCLCNGLMAAVGLGQALGDGEEEAAIVTAGEDVRQVARFLSQGKDAYTAADVLRHVLGDRAAVPDDLTERAAAMSSGPEKG